MMLASWAWLWVPAVFVTLSLVPLALVGGSDPEEKRRIRDEYNRWKGHR